MTIIQKLLFLVGKKVNFFLNFNVKTLQFQKLNPYILLSFLIIFSAIFFVSSNLIQKKSYLEANALGEVAKNTNFLNYRHSCFL